MEKYVIEDWAGNSMLYGLVFDSYDDAWEFLYEQFPEDDGTLEDIYVIPITQNN